MNPKLRNHKSSILAILVMVLATSTLLGGYYLGLSNAPSNIVEIEVESDNEVHTWIRQYRDTDGDGIRELIFEEYNAGVVTNIGLDFNEGKLGNDAFVNNTAFAEYLSMSTDSSSPVATWVNIPNEISGSGLARAEGTYASTGTGVYTITYTFTASAQVVDIQLFANSWDDTIDDGSLFFADTCTPFTVENNDQIELTATVTIT